MSRHVLSTGVAAACAMAVCLGSGRALAQSWEDERDAPAAGHAQSGQPIDPEAVSGPTIYVVDKSNHLATINLGTKAVRIIGTMAETLTDIAFSPRNHALYGVSFSGFYEIDKTSAATRYIGGLGQSDVNALVFTSANTCYAAGINTGDLYVVSPGTGQARVVGSTGGYASAGDLVTYNDQLVLAGFQGLKNVSDKTQMYLVTLNQKTGAHEGVPVAVPVRQLFGLVSTGKNELYGLGFATQGPALYRLTPSEPTYSKRATLLELLSGSGLSKILGAAYDGNYQP